MAGKFGEWLKGIGKGGEGFMGKFGTGQGAIADAFRPINLESRKGYYDEAGKQDVLAGRYNPQYPSQTAYADDTGMVNINPQSGHQSRINTGDIDFANPEQVAQIQQSLLDWGAKDTVGSNIGQPIAVDSIWGQNTEDNYRRYINERRGQQGLDEYNW